jgi:hypothetical protein
MTIDTLYIDLPTLKNAFETPLDLSLARLNRLSIEVTVSSEIVAAVLANELGILDSILGPDNARAALLAFKARGDRSFDHELAPGIKPAGG